jgi:hypothetical protein
MLLYSMASNRNCLELPWHVTKRNNFIRNF